MGRYEFLEDVALADGAIEIEGQSLDGEHWPGKAPTSRMHPAAVREAG